jgi:hypothetical protein
VSGNNVPWGFDEARAAARMASQQQRQSEEAIRVAYRDSALKEEAYRIALAKRIVELHVVGDPEHDIPPVAWSVAQDVARGTTLVARLKREWEIAEGVKEAAGQAGWRASKDRDDTQSFVDWSKRREMAEAR